MAFLALTPALLLLVSPARAACDDPAEKVSLVEQAVLDARFDDARDHLAQAEAAFGCTGTADNTLLARLWLAEGAMAHIEGDERSRDQAFASAARVAPDTWTTAFGDDLRTAWEAAAAAPRGQGQLQLEGLDDGAVAMVDGQPMQVPAELDSGLYLVQADAKGGPPVFARIVLVPDDQTLVVRVEDPHNLDQTATLEPRKRKKWPWFAAAGGAAVLGGTAALLATTQENAIQDSSSVDDLNGAFGRQKAFAYTSYGLAGATAVLVGVGVAW